MKYFIPFILIGIFCLPPESHASCGSASCPLNNHQYLQAGFFNIMLSREYINQDRVFVGSQLSFIGAIPEHHDEVQTINERSTLQIQFGLSDRLGLAVNAPFITRQHSHIHHHMGEDLWESWNYSGFGDMIISGQYALLLPETEFEPYLSIQIGAKLATGVTDMKNIEGEEAEVTIQPGSGSTDGIFGFYYRQTLASVPTLSGEFSALPLSVGASYQATGKGTDGWKFGNTLLAHISTSYQFANRASVLLQINGRFQGKADVGTTNEPGDNTGGTWIYISPGLSVNLNNAIFAFGYIQMPVYQHVNGIQQTSAFNLQFGVSASVDLLANDLL